MSNKLKILVVDDSLVYRRILTQAVEQTGLGRVIYTASNGELALERLEQSEIDVVIMDVYMPGMSGIEILGIIKDRYPDKIVIMISGGGKDSAKLTMQALEMGAMDFILKPAGDDIDKNMQKIKGYLHVLFAQILTSRYSREFRGRVEPRPPTHLPTQREPMKDTLPVKPIIKTQSEFKRAKLDRADIILIASSTGGPAALERIFTKLPPDIQVPILVVQHMPPTFTKMLSQTLDKKGSLEVYEGTSNELVRKNSVFIAPGGYHMVVRRKHSNGIRIHLEDTQQVHGVKPAADVLFTSVAKTYRGKNVLAIILTGMGNDGRDGVRELKTQCNCYCITQSEDSCVVYGMPKAVYDANLSDEVVHIEKIAGRIIDIVTGRG